MKLPATLGEALASARGLIPGAEARLLLREASGERAAIIVGFPERPLNEDAAARFMDWLARRGAGSRWLTCLVSVNSTAAASRFRPLY